MLEDKISREIVNYLIKEGNISSRNALNFLKKFFQIMIENIEIGEEVELFENKYYIKKISRSKIQITHREE